MDKEHLKKKEKPERDHPKYISPTEEMMTWHYYGKNSVLASVCSFEARMENK